jgi:hypothetical protein
MLRPVAHPDDNVQLSGDGPGLEIAQQSHPQMARHMKTLLSLGALVLATTAPAKAECVSYPAVRCVPPLPIPNHLARVRHVAKRPKPQHHDQDEKAPLALPSH